MTAERIKALEDALREQAANAIIELRAELSKANELLAFIDAAMPPANENCEEPGISFLEAARRELADRKHMGGM